MDQSTSSHWPLHRELCAKITERRNLELLCALMQTINAQWVLVNYKLRLTLVESSRRKLGIQSSLQRVHSQ